jgi:type I restriction enzyme R subunit
LHSGDAIDLKQYEPAMRHLIDAYIRAEESEKVSAFDDLSLIQLIVQRGVDAVEALPEGIRKNKQAVAETIENNVRRLIIDESPINPKYFERMSQLLDALIAQRRQEALDYQEYLRQVVALTRQVKNGPGGAAYPTSLDTQAKRALYDNLDKNEELAVAVDAAVRTHRQDEWRGNVFKVKKVRNAIIAVIEHYQSARWTLDHPEAVGPGADGSDPYEGRKTSEVVADRVLELVKNQHDY